MKKTKLVVRHYLLTYSGKARLAYYILLRLSAGSLMTTMLYAFDMLLHHKLFTLSTLHIGSS